MAKISVKQPAKEPRKPSPTNSASKISSTERIEKVCEEAFYKLKSLNVDQSLQNDIEWCLGSYRSDKNPVGLYGVAERALAILKSEKDKKTKGVTTKLIGDIEKAIQSR